MNPMQVQFIGATGTVTGSKYLLRADGKNFLIDCGLFQGLKVLRLRNWKPLPVPPKTIEAVVLTHAHVDHSGYLPLLVKDGFRGAIYATEGTRDLCQILLPDSGHLQEEDAEFLNRHKLSKHQPALPLYTEEDALESLRYFKGVPWQKRTVLSKELSFEFLPAGHILGAAFVQFFGGGRRITFSGDLGRPKELIMFPPKSPPETDYLVIESTYGDRRHPSEDSKAVLRDMILKTIERGGIVLIPSFAVGRAQEVLYLIGQLKKSKEIPDVPVYLNSPMAIRATRLYGNFVGEHALTSEESEELCGTARFVTTVEESKHLNTLTEPAIIISASGMATGGRVLHHLKFLAPDPKNLILFVGFQAAGTRGEAMVHGADHVKIHGTMVPIRAEVRSIDTLSAHADADEIMAWLKNFSKAPKMTFITHGESLASEALRKRIQEELHWSCTVPDYLETFELT